jgi:hypothetical protein
MGGYRKTQKGDNNIANEQLAHNNLFIDFGYGGLVFACITGILIIAAIIWMAVRNGGLLGTLVSLTIIGFFAGAWIFGILFLMRYASGTRRQLNSDKAAESWEKLLHYTDSHVVLMDPRTQTFRIENARDIQEVRHFNDKPQTVISEVAQSKQQTDLDAFSQTLNRGTDASCQNVLPYSAISFATWSQSTIERPVKPS